MEVNPEKLIDLGEMLRTEVPKLPISWLSAPLSGILAVTGFNNAYANVHKRLQQPGNTTTFFQAFLDELDVTYEISHGSVDLIPKEGPVIAVSNHPFGCIEGVILGNLLENLRADAKLLANYLLNRIPEIRPSLIAINPFESSRGNAANIRGIKQTIRFLKDGGLLGTFPSGAISNFQWSERAIVDPPWQPDVSGLARRTGAAVVPIFFEGRNNFLFQSLGKLHPNVRTAMMLRELMNKRGRTIRLRIGRPLRFQADDDFETDEKRTQYLRLRTYALGTRNSEGEKRETQPSGGRHASTGDPVIAPIEPGILASEFDTLPADTVIVDQGKLRLHIVRADQIPNGIREIGRLREVTFREVGEGSGKDCDLDDFDNHYLHLVLWNTETSEIGGSYRMGPTDTIIPERGPRGLYTTTLFKFQPEFLERLNPGIELGRSFIRATYQRKHNSLFLLWKALLTYACRNPRYKLFFGPVSISKDYNAISKNLLVQFLRRRFFHPELSFHVKPRNPFRAPKMFGLGRKNISETLINIEHVSGLISEVEDDGKGIPILIRQYLKMNSTLLSFNVDPDFSDVLDGLILTDLTQTDRRLLNRYMGENEAEEFLAFHAAKS